MTNHKALVFDVRVVGFVYVKGTQGMERGLLIRFFFWCMLVGKDPYEWFYFTLDTDSLVTVYS